VDSSHHAGRRPQARVGAKRFDGARESPPVAARVARAALGLSPGLRTPPTRSRTTHARVGTGHRARTWNYAQGPQLAFIDLQSGSSLIRATSCRTSPRQPRNRDFRLPSESVAPSSRASQTRCSAHAGIPPTTCVSRPFGVAQLEPSAHTWTGQRAASRSNRKRTGAASGVCAPGAGNVGIAA
jgi:hypothetical protein